MISRREVLVFVAALGGAALAPSRLLAAAAGRRVFEIPVELDANRLVIACMIGGHGPYLFAIDTGGVVSLIRNDIANQLGLRVVGHSALGVGGRSGIYPLFDGNDVAFGNNLRQSHVVFAGVDQVRFGKDVMGSLAAGCLTAYDSEIDFGDKLWRVYPDGAPVRGGWMRHDDAIVNDGPSGGSSYLFGRAHLGSQALRCLLDTGAPGWLRLSGDAARASGLLSGNQNWSPVGKNGAGVARLVRSGKTLTFGGLAVPRPVVVVQDEKGNRLSDALIGLPVLQQLAKWAVWSP
jgi:hypothetical protein